MTFDFFDVIIDSLDRKKQLGEKYSEFPILTKLFVYSDYAKFSPVKLKERKEMRNTREFYPMITRTVKTLIGILEEQDENLFLTVLQWFPDIDDIDQKCITPIVKALIDELNRQYERWNVGGGNGK